MARHYLTVSNKVVLPISRRRGSTRINDAEPVAGAWISRPTYREAISRLGRPG